MRLIRLLCITLAIGAVTGWAAAQSADDADWPQLQRDASRSGYSPLTVEPPYRARWIWFSKDWVLRNKDSEAGPEWTDDLTSGDNKNYRMPKNLPYSFSGQMQPVVAAGRVFVADCQGAAYAVSLDDGATLWTAPNPGGTMVSGVATPEVVAFTSLTGAVTGYEATTGRKLWSVDTGKAITTAPALVDGVVYAASQNGRVYAIQIADGEVLWKSDPLGAAVVGGLCVHDGMVYTGIESMDALAIDAKTGEVKVSRKLIGQSFRMVWPVGAGDRVIFTTVPVICVGSEYVNDGVLAGRPGQQVGWTPDIKPGNPNAAAEGKAIRKWLDGDGKPWETCFALKTGTLDKDYIIPTGATEGCGTPPNPPTLDKNGQPLLWWSTGFPTLTKLGTFGSNFSSDLSALNLKTGDRILIDNKRFSGQTVETDNLYAVSVGKDIAYLRQNFRGTWFINLANSRGGHLSAVYRYRDGGGWPAAVNYAHGEVNGRIPPDGVRVPATPPAPAGRVAPIVAGKYLIFAENFGITCVETAK